MTLLTEWQKAGIKAPEARRAILRNIRELEDHLLDTCPCKFELPDDNVSSEVRTRWATVCNICSTSHGWYCDISPDHTCHYPRDIIQVEVHDKRLRLIDKSIIPLSNKVLKDWQKHENACIFCGKYEKRR